MKSKQRAQRTQKLTDVIGEIDGISAVYPAKVLQDLLKDWSEIAGPQLALYTCPKTLHGNVLIIEADDGLMRSRLSDLEHHFARVLRPFDLIDFKFISKPKTNSAVAKSTEISAESVQQTEDIEDEQLRFAMARLLTSFEQGRR